jgi:Protein of unknown function (DUF1091)
VSNVSAAVFNDSDFVSRVNISMLLKVDLQEIIVSVVFKNRVGNSKEYNHHVLSIQTNTCRVEKGVLGNFIIKALAENLRNYSNYKFVCPLKKGFYYARNFPTIQLDELPLSFLRSKLLIVDWEASGIVKVKEANVRKVAGSFKAYGTTVF